MRRPAPGFDDADDEVDGFGDGALRRRGRCLGHEIFEADEAGARVIGVKGGDAARMAGVPGFQEIERFSASHLADKDTVGTKPQGGSEQAAEIGRLAAPEQDRVPRLRIGFPRRPRE